MFHFSGSFHHGGALQTSPGGGVVLGVCHPKARYISIECISSIPWPLRPIKLSIMVQLNILANSLVIQSQNNIQSLFWIFSTFPPFSSENGIYMITCKNMLSWKIIDLLFDISYCIYLFIFTSKRSLFHHSVKWNRSNDNTFALVN